MASQNTASSDSDPQANLDRLRRLYDQEKSKRLRDDGEVQYIDLRHSSTLDHYLADPWIRATTSPDLALASGNRCKYLIIGIGFSGILNAVRLIEAGIDVDDIRLIDKADGFGGTWYYNRFPGACCDVESHVYIPLLEEIGWMPSHKYSYGYEIREICEAIATKYGLRERTFFRRNVRSMTWNEEGKEWVVAAEPEGAAEGKEPIELRAQFALLGIGLMDRPKLSDLPGIQDFKGKSLHSCRWDYEYTGGSQSNPAMTKLEDKTVGIIGTGCTAIQVVPQVAKHAKHLYVFQRTPASVAQRKNPPTDPAHFRNNIAHGPGWQDERRRNYAAFTHGLQPEVDLVNDEMTNWVTCSGLAGHHHPVTIDEAPAFFKKLESEDVPHTEALRQSVDTIVKDKETAQKLKFYYNSWCKRPTFHDGYLQAFNRQNVTLVDTDGKGVERITRDGIVANGTEYPVDLLVYSTGYKIGTGGWDPAARADMRIIGRGGVDMIDVFRNGIDTYQGIAAHGFPNLLWDGPAQSGFTANQTYVIDSHAKHFAYILSHLPKEGKVVFEPTREACEAWVQRYLETTPNLMHAAACGPNYFNQEGDLQKEAAKGPDVMMKLMKSGVWGTGVLNYNDILLEWQKDGKLGGLKIETYSN